LDFLRGDIQLSVRENEQGQYVVESTDPNDSESPLVVLALCPDAVAAMMLQDALAALLRPAPLAEVA
jgi:hypothetical protein